MSITENKIDTDSVAGNSTSDDLQTIITERKQRIFNYKTLIFLLFSIILAFFLIKSIDTNKTYDTLKNADFALMSLSILIYAFSNFFKMIRFKVLLKNKIPLYKFYTIVSYHNFFNMIMPARTGELTLVYYLKKIGGVKASKGLHSLILARIFDLIVVSIYFVIALLVYYGTQTSKSLLALGIIVGLFSFIFLLKISFVLSWSTNVIKKIFKAIHLDKHRFVVSFINKLVEINDEFKNFNTGSYLPLMILTSVFVWLALYTLSYISIIVLNVEITYLKTIIGSTGAILTNVLPINSFGSFGTLEAGWTGGFILVGMSAQDAITTGFGAHVINFLASAVVALLSKIVFEIKRLSVKE
ncbi:MAG TPA: lysylphosphatidylglycerol synthase transmembrane domain-containing protein [Spirochaetota bacterium]|nr:lysylphosphatidylglycerol synthase transmembrane domain-containing protein [Spirochaetota bacterium]